MARPRSKHKARWTSRRFSIGFIENYRDGGIAYARIGDWRKSLAPLRFVPANRQAGIAILERLIEVGAESVPPSLVRITAGGRVEIARSRGDIDASGSLFRHLRAYRLRRESEGVSASWLRTFKAAHDSLIGDVDMPLDAQAIRAVITDKISRSELAPRSLDAYTAVLRRAFQDAVDARLLEFNPLQGFKVKIPEAPVLLWTEKEEAEIYAAITEPRRLDYFRLLRLSAMRRAEAATLTRDSLIEIPGGRHALRIFGKGGRTRLLPIGGAEGKSGQAAEWNRDLESLVLDLVRNPADGESGALFDWSSPNVPTHFLRSIRDQIGHKVPDTRGPHTFRKCALNDWVRFGVDDDIITAWAGNSRRIRSKHYYTPTSPADAAAALDSILLP